MKKWLLKMLIPSPEKLAVYAADAVLKTVNGASEGRKKAIAKYAAIAEEAAESARCLAAILRDGHMDDAERDTIAAMLVPLAEKVEGLL